MLCMLLCIKALGTMFCHSQDLTCNFNYDLLFRDPKGAIHFKFSRQNLFDVFKRDNGNGRFLI